METKDLMIGDWVYNHRMWECPIVEIHKNSAIVIAKHYGEEEFKIEDLKPIPLTPEILEKNGFIRNIHNIYELEINVENIRFHISYQTYYKSSYLYIEINGHFDSEIQIKINYVHELQHALHLCGIEKEIEL